MRVTGENLTFPFNQGVILLILLLKFPHFSPLELKMGVKIFKNLLDGLGEFQGLPECDLIGKAGELTVLLYTNVMKNTVFWPKLALFRADRPPQWGLKISKIFKKNQLRVQTYT